MPQLTDEEWRDHIDALLTQRLDRLDLYNRYYVGDHRLAFATSKFKEAFGELFEAFATNWCGLVVDVAAERLKIRGFRFGDDLADEESRKIWQANGLDQQSLMAHTEAIKSGCAYLLVSEPRESGGEPVISAELPSQCYVVVDPADPRIRLAGYKKYKDANGDIVAVLYLPERTVVWRRPAYTDRLMSLGVQLPTGVADFTDKKIIPNKLGVVPMIPLENSPDLGTGGKSDLRSAIALNDAANKFFTDMIHASEFTAFPQRVLTGVEIPRDPVTNEILPAAELKAAVSRLWAFEAPDASVFQLAAGELSNYVEGIDLAVQHMAAQTRTPPHYLLAKLINLSGDALKAAESGLVARCRRKHIDFSDPWEETMRVSFKMRGRKGDAERSKMLGAETIWADPENINPQVLSQSLVQKAEIGVPWEQLMEEANYSPEQVNRMRKWREKELNEAAAREALAIVEAQAKVPQNGGPNVETSPERAPIRPSRP